MAGLLMAFFPTQGLAPLRSAMAPAPWLLCDDAPWADFSGSQTLSFLFFFCFKLSTHHIVPRYLNGAEVGGCRTGEENCRKC